jgi:hypothetical protein
MLLRCMHFVSQDPCDHWWRQAVCGGSVPGEGPAAAQGGRQRGAGPGADAATAQVRPSDKQYSRMTGCYEGVHFKLLLVMDCNLSQQEALGQLQMRPLPRCGW